MTSTFRITALLLSAVCVQPFVRAQTYAQSWDRWADRAVPTYWTVIANAPPKEDQAHRLRAVKINIEHHDTANIDCQSAENIASSERVSDHYEITICARQLRFLLHFMDSVTTGSLTEGANYVKLQNALSAGDVQALKAFNDRESFYMQKYADHIIRSLRSEIDAIPLPQETIAYQCGSNYFKMLMDKREDYASCNHGDEIHRSNELEKWYASDAGPGGSMIQAVSQAAARRVSIEEVRKAESSLHEEINRLTVIFILLHEAAHIINGDPDRIPMLDSKDRSDARVEAAADALALNYIVKNRVYTKGVVAGPIIVPQAVILYVRYLYETGPARLQSRDVKVRISSVRDYLQALATVPTDSPNEAKALVDNLQMLRMFPSPNVN